jgi:hypothetical protein
MKAFLVWMVVVMVALGTPLPTTAMASGPPACASMDMGGHDMPAPDCCDQNCAMLGGACATCAAVLAAPHAPHPGISRMAEIYVLRPPIQMAQHGFEVDPPPPRSARV